MGNPVLLPAIILIPTVAALLALAIGRHVGRWAGLCMVAAALTAFVLTLGFLGADPAPRFSVPWMPTLGIEFALRADRFGVFFALLVSGIGTLVGSYSLAYIPDLGGSRLGQYAAALTGFMAAMLGIALADDLILLFVFWEVTSITSFVLIGFWYEQDTARRGALTALQVTGLGGLAMLAGFVLVGLVTGTYSVSQLTSDAALRETLAASPLAPAALLLIMAGAFTKSAQVPFHFWLPGAMVAPTPVSTYLHAATMVKAGIFLAGRMLPLFVGATLWTPLLTSFGLATFALGAFLAMRETDLKAILAQTTVSTLGLVMMLYGLDAPDQDALQMLSHAAYKGALFLTVGIVEHATHTRDLGRLGGLRARLPVTFWVCALAALSMAGLPPFLGFLAKEALYAELLSTGALGPGLRWIVIAVVVASNACIFAVSMKILVGVFLGSAPMADTHDDEHPDDPHGESPALWGPPAVLASCALILGLLALLPATERLVNLLSSDPHAHLHLRLVPEHAGPVMLSVVTVVLGALLYRARATAAQIQARLDHLPSMQRAWDALLDAVTRFAVAYSTRWQSGSLRWYLSGILAFFVGLVAFGLGRGGLSLGDATIGLAELPWYAIALAALLVTAAISVVRATTRLAAALASTAVGLLVALVFVVYRSPDILLTQILIETVSTIFILLVLYFMPAFRPDGLSVGQTTWIAAVSGAVGAVMFVLVLLCTSPEFRETRNLAADYLTRSFTEAGGHNAVNVIIVDFRAIDTTGEITVLVLVALCVYGLLRARREAA